MSMSTSGTPEIASETLDKHLQYIRRLIITDALRVAAEKIPSGGEPTTSPPVPKEQDIWLSALKYAPGSEFVSHTDVNTRPKTTIIDKILGANWTNTAVLSVLTLVFGVLGLAGLGMFGTGTNPEAVKQLAPFLDIAKIFAGAIVGSASATAVAAASRRNP